MGCWVCLGFDSIRELFAKKRKNPIRSINFLWCLSKICCLEAKLTSIIFLLLFFFVFIFNFYLHSYFFPISLAYIFLFLLLFHSHRLFGRLGATPWPIQRCGPKMGSFTFLLQILKKEIEIIQGCPSWSTENNK